MSKRFSYGTLHSSATMTDAVHRAIQISQVSIRSLAEQYGINSKSVAKWRSVLIRKMLQCILNKSGLRC